MNFNTSLKAICLSILVIFGSINSFSQSACSASNYASATVVPANGYPYFSPGTGITVTAVTAGGVTTLNNFQYSCNNVTYNCTNPAWWLNSAAQSITFTFSQPVSSFSVIVNGTNNCEEFYFTAVNAPQGCVTSLCPSPDWVTIPGGLRYNGAGATSNLIIISNPTGATSYVLTHNGCGAGSRYALVDCLEIPSSATPTLTSTMTSIDATCGNCDGSATVTPSGGTAPYSYSWNTVPVQTTQTATNLCAGTYIVNFGETNGCLVGSDTVTIIGSPSLPPPVITPAGPFCTIDPPINLSATPVGGTWSGIGITNTASGTFDPNTAGVGTHQIIYEDSALCGDADTINIVVTLNNNATINPAGPVCPGDAPFNLTAVDPGGTWSGTGITSAINGTFDPLTAGPGTHTVTYAIGGSCGDTQTVNIVVNPYLDATITPAGPFCVNDLPFNLTAVDPGGTWSGTGITNASTGTFDPMTAGGGTHTITYGIPGGCGDTNTINIVVTILDDATITPAGPFCAVNTPIVLTSATPGGTWSGTGITNPATGTFNPSIAGAGTHTITYTTAGNCSNTDTENIIVNPLPVVSFIADTLSLCVVPSTPFEFANTTGGLGSTVVWDFGDGTNGYSDIESHTYTNPGIYTISLTVTTSAAAGGCTSTLTKNNYVTLHENPTASFTMSPSQVTMFDPTINFYDQSYTNIVAWDWNIGNFVNSNQQNPSYTFPEDTGSYLVVLTVTDGFGCENTTTDIAVVKGEFAIYVPNAFTPDGDGNNDGFYPDGFGFSDVGYSFLIFDRWGEVIFESHKKFQPWNGTYKGKLVPGGVYVWRVQFKDLDGKVHDKTGHVTIIR